MRDERLEMIDERREMRDERRETGDGGCLAAERCLKAVIVDKPPAETSVKSVDAVVGNSMGRRISFDL